MIEIAVAHGGMANLPVKRLDDGMCILDGNMQAMQDASHETLIAQVRQGVLAEKLGFDAYYLTEHHFQPEGIEFNPNPLLTQAAIAAETSRIRLGQSANIITWWHPLRLAEQIATLDVLSGGRVEAGIGRGYQPREVETLGRPYGGSIQDEERNRTAFEEAYEILLKAWTELSFSHHGENFSIPPTYTSWHHPQTIAYFNQPGIERSIDDVLELGPEPEKLRGPAVFSSSTKLKELSVYPQPVQKPYPQIWLPMTSPRSVAWAAQRGVNGFHLGETNSRLKESLDLYYETAEKAGFPDRLDRGPFARGWDGQQRRGQMPGRWVHIVQPGIGDMDRAGRAMEAQYEFYRGFGIHIALSEADEPLLPFDATVSADLLRSKEVAVHGSAEFVAESLLNTKEYCGFDDYAVQIWFELAGFSTQEIEEQMHCFAEEVMPVLRQECGGGPELPTSTVDMMTRVSA